MIKAIKVVCDLVFNIFNSGLFSALLSGFITLILIEITLRIVRHLDCGGFTFQKEPDTQEEEITYENLYDDELLELMAKYDEMDKQYKKEGDLDGFSLFGHSNNK